MRTIGLILLLLLVGCARDRTDLNYAHVPGSFRAAEATLAFPKDARLAANYTLPRNELSQGAFVGYDSAEVTTSLRVVDDYQSFSASGGRGGWSGGAYSYGGSYQRRAYEVVQQQRVR